MIGAYPHGRTVFPADLNQRSKLLTNAFKLCFIRGIRIFDRLKSFFISVIARIDSNLFDNSCSQFGGIRGEMNICDEWCIVTASSQFLLYFCQVLRLFYAWRRNTNILTARFYHSDGLLHRAVCVHCIHGGHGLNANWICSAQRYITDLHFNGLPPAILHKASAILFYGCYLMAHPNKNLTAKITFKARICSKDLGF